MLQYDTGVCAWGDRPASADADKSLLRKKIF